MQGIGYAHRIGNRIGNPIVDPRKAGGADVAEPGHLQRRGTPRKHADTRRSEVTAQIDKDVDPVAQNGGGDIGITVFAHIAPYVGGGDETPGHVVVLRRG